LGNPLREDKIAERALLGVQLHLTLLYIALGAADTSVERIEVMSHRAIFAFGAISRSLAIRG
jgi:hypothetical protein